MRSSSLKSYQIAAGLLALPLMSLPALAQQPIALPGITVQGATLEAPPPARAPTPAPAATSGSAERRPLRSDAATPSPAASRSTRSAPPSSVVTGDELRAQQVRTALPTRCAACRASRSAAPAASASLTQVRIRGAEGNHTLVLIDGVEANNPTDGEFDFSNLSAEDIERIEVIRGPMSAPLRLQRRRRRHQHHHAQGPWPAGLDGAQRDRLTWHQRHCRAVSPPATRSAISRPAPIGARPTATISRPSAARPTACCSRATASAADYSWPPISASTCTCARSTSTPTATASAARRGSHLPRRSTTPRTCRTSCSWAGCALQWDTLDKQLTQQLRVDYNKTTISDADLAFGPPAFLTTNTGDRTTYNYLATYRFDTPAIWAKHTFSGLVETRVRDLPVRGHPGRRRAARAQPSLLRRRMAWRLRRPGVPHGRRAPRLQQRV